MSENLDLIYFNRFKSFVESYNLSSLKGDKFKYESDFDSIKTLLFEKWNYTFKHPNKDCESFISLNLIHKGLNLDTIRENLKNDKSYNVLVDLYGDRDIVGYGLKICLNLLDYKEFILDLLYSNFNIGSLILNFVSDYVKTYGFSLKSNLKEVFYKRYCEDYEYFINDIVLDKDFEDKYKINKILYENRDFTVTKSISKLNKTHRFLVLSTQYKSVLNETRDLRKAFFKVIDVFHFKGQCQITLLHLPAPVWQIFKVENFNLDNLIKDSREHFINSFNLDLNSKEDYPNVYSLGLNDTGDYISFPNSNLNSLDLKTKLTIINKILEYNVPYLEQGKFPAPHWLVYPELSSSTIGWRMGYGEEYINNFYDVIRNLNTFNKLFPEPLNWSFKYVEAFDKYVGGPKPYYSIGWSEKGKSKYNRYMNYENTDIISFKEIFPSSFFSEEFRINATRFENFDDAIKDAKSNKSFANLNRKLKKEIWYKTKYTLYLNLLYYKIMPKPDLIEKLLDTGDKLIIYKHHDKYLGTDLIDNKITGHNKLGFALMELRDEIKRLYKNNDSIDWFYTEFLKHAPYMFAKYTTKDDILSKSILANKQSPEYKIFEATYFNIKAYVRDLDLDKDLINKYKIGKIIQERAFVDASDKIGGMSKNTRFTILSNHIGDLSSFEGGKDWGLHTTSANSVFKVLDVYEYENKTQILLLHLNKGFWQVFESNDTIRVDCVNKMRKKFQSSCNEEVISSLNDEIWYKRCDFPIGLDNNGEFWKII